MSDRNVLIGIVKQRKIPHPKLPLPPPSESLAVLQVNTVHLQDFDSSKVLRSFIAQKFYLRTVMIAENIHIIYIL